MVPLASLISHRLKPTEGFLFLLSVFALKVIPERLRSDAWKPGFQLKTARNHFPSVVSCIRAALLLN